MRKYDLIIWDVDGTLLDTSEGIVSSASYAIKKAGLEVPDNNIMKTFIGPPIQKTFAKYFSITEQQSLDMANVFRDRYKDHDLYRAKPYDGIMNLIKTISRQGIKQGIATYKRQDYAEKILKYFGFTPYVDVLYGSDFEGKLTKRDIISNVIRESGVADLQKIVMIGDTDNDRKGANELGIEFIAVTYGFGFKSKDVYPTMQRANNIEMLSSLLEVSDEN